MTAVMMDGREVAREIRRRIASEVATFERQFGLVPTVAVVQLGQEPASARYVRQIQRSFRRSGMGFVLRALPETVSSRDLLEVIKNLNADTKVHGIIVQLPLPPHLDVDLVSETIDPAKDVDGVHPLNAGRFLRGSGHYFVPATPAGGMELLKHYRVSLEGKRAVVVGRSTIVGRPMAMLLLHANATVTICHSRTRDLAAYTRQADILAVAVGRPRLITVDMVKEGAAIVDFGINVLGDGSIVGDVDRDVAEVAAYLTPVPGGTGPMTNALLLLNTLMAAQRQVCATGFA